METQDRAVEPVTEAEKEIKQITGEVSEKLRQLNEKYPDLGVVYLVGIPPNKEHMKATGFMEGVVVGNAEDVLTLITRATQQVMAALKGK